MLALGARATPPPRGMARLTRLSSPPQPSGRALDPFAVGCFFGLSTSKGLGLSLSWVQQPLSVHAIPSYASSPSPSSPSPGAGVYAWIQVVGYQQGPSGYRVSSQRLATASLLKGISSSNLGRRRAAHLWSDQVLFVQHSEPGRHATDFLDDLRRTYPSP